MADTATNTKKIHSKSWHIAWRAIIGSIDSILALGGIIMIILGIVSDYLPGKASENWTGNAEFKAAMGFDYRWFGFILLAAAVVIMVIFFNVMARHNEADKEREMRRQERMKVLAASVDHKSEPVKEEQTSPAVEVNATEVKEEPKEDISSETPSSEETK